MKTLKLNNVTTSRKWVQVHAEFLSEIGLSIYPWLLKYGRDFPPPMDRARWPKEIKPGKMKECFSNAGRVVLKRGDSPFTYCEGFAIPQNLFPMEHAWLIDADGNTIDPTWEDATNYFGVAFQRSYVVAECLRTEHYGLLSHRPNMMLLRNPHLCIMPFKEKTTDKRKDKR